MTSEDAARLVGELTDGETARRVVRSALYDPEARVRLRAATVLHEEAAAYAASADADAGNAVASARVGEAMRAAVAAFVPPPPSLGAQEQLRRLRASGGGLWRGAGEAWDALVEGLALVSRALATGRPALGLPCLAPALAAPLGGEVRVLRETITVAGGAVRVEFHELPGVDPARLRVLVDASGLGTAPLGEAANVPSLDASISGDLGYNVAFLTLEEDAAAAAPPSSEAAPPLRDRHILVIGLNENGRGFSDFTIGNVAATVGDALRAFLPAPRGVCRLTGVTLSRLSREA